MEYSLKRETRRIGAAMGWIVAAMVPGLVASGAAQATDAGTAPRDSAATIQAPMLLAQAGAGQVQAALDALIKAAKAEGEVTMYSAAPESIPKRVGAAFTAKYGIKTGFVRLSTAPLARKYMAEAEAGTFAADVIITAGSGEPYSSEGIKKGWIEAVSQAKLPILTSGEFPAKFNDGITPVVQVSPWMIAYNSDLVKGADVPKDWADVLSPKWKGKMILADPRVGTVFTQFWMLMLDKYGEGFFEKIRALEPRRYPSGIPAVQAMAAGEGAIYPPVIEPVVAGVKSKGAPVKTVTPDFTTGVMFYIALTAPDKAKHPNAGRLLANYILSPDGNKVFNDEPGSAGVYDTSRLPKEFQLPKPVTKAQVDRAAKLLGY